LTTKKICYPIIAIFLITIFTQTYIANATSSLTFHGVGIDVDLDFPQEAHPQDNIYHTVTITSKISPYINNLTLTIYGTVNQVQQEITNLALISWSLQDPLTNKINLILPKETLGQLYCTIYIKTNQDTDYYFTSFYTTQVNPITFSELLVDYESKLIELENSEARYDSLLADYNDLNAKHDTLEDNYQSTLESYNTLLNEYKTLNSTYTDLQGNYTQLQEDYNSLIIVNEQLQTQIEELQTEIEDLNIDLEESDNRLLTDRNLMIIFIIILVSLIGLIIYLRNKQKEPYVVIRKETVSMKPEKK